MIIETYCFIWDTRESQEIEKLKELGVYTENTPEETVCPLAFKLEEIAAVRPEIEEGSITDNSIIYMKSGESFVIKMSYDSLIKTIKGNQ